MTDTTPPAQPEPTPPTQPEPTPPASGYTAQPAATPYQAGGAPAKSPILSIIALIAGILGFLGSGLAFIPLVGIIAWPVPIAAVILGFLGKKKEPQAAKGLWLTGLILGFVALAICILGLLVWVLAFATAPYSSSFS